ncbi:MAG: hypothetical protein ACRDOI_33855 [Trebonia sp.]
MSLGLASGPVHEGDEQPPSIDATIAHNAYALWHPDGAADAIPHYGVVAIKPGKLPS